jgi:hypothetical protein
MPLGRPATTVYDASIHSTYALVKGFANIRAVTLFVSLIVLSGPVAATRCAPGSLTWEITHVRDGDTVEVGRLLVHRLVWQRGREPGEGLVPSPVH